MNHFSTPFFTGLLLCGLASFVLTEQARAHESPEHVIDDLTAEILEQGPTAERYFRRACEYRALRRYPQAEADLRRARDLTSQRAADDELGPLPIDQELVRVLLRQGKLDAAAELAAALCATVDPHSRQAKDGALLALRGETELARQDYAAAATSFRLALATRHEVGWYVLRARAQAELGQRTARLAGLRAGYAATGSPVLLRAVCDALLVAGPEFHAEAAQIIERELVDCRYPSAWLVRRARILQQQGRTVAAAADLQAAIVELNERIHPERPDVALLVERGRAAAMRGQFAAAEADLKRAEARHAPAWMTDELRKLLPAVAN